MTITPLQDMYLIWASKYIYLGRYEALQPDPIMSGYLFHLGVEFLLKAALLRKFTLKQLKFLGHDLTLLWQSAKGLFSPVDLNAHDFVVEALNEFGEIRYPDQFQGKKVAFNVRIGSLPGLAQAIAPGAKIYSIEITSIDNLVLDIYKQLDVPPVAYFKSLNENHVGYGAILTEEYLRDES